MSFEEYLQEELATLEDDTLYEVGDINCEWELEYTTQEWVSNTNVSAAATSWQGVTLSVAIRQTLCL